jgi:DNA modification methylase
MKNFYRLIQGDCLKVLGLLRDNCVDLVITSPPYWNTSNHDGAERYKSYLTYLEKRFIEIFRVLRNEGKFCLNVASIPFEGVKEKPQIHFVAADVYQKAKNVGFSPLAVIFWNDYLDKDRIKPSFDSYPYPSNLSVSICIEPILIFSKQICKARKKERSNDIMEKSKLTEREWKSWCIDYWRFPKNLQKKEHSFAFPEELPRRLIRMYSFVGDVVLDPFLGGGTTMKVAQTLNRSCIGIEINPKRCEVAKQRCFRNKSLQQKSECTFEIVE